MSRLVFTGDLNKNFGEFYPTPYIDMVFIRNATDATTGSPTRGSFQLDINFSLLFNVPDVDPALPNRDVDFVKEIINRTNLYFIIT